MWCRLPPWRCGRSSVERHGGCMRSTEGHRWTHGRRIGLPATRHAGERGRRKSAARHCKSATAAGSDRAWRPRRGRGTQWRQGASGTPDAGATGVSGAGAWAWRKAGMRTPGRWTSRAVTPGAKNSWARARSLPRGADVPVHSRRVPRAARSDDEWTTGPGLHSCRGPCGGAHRAHRFARVHAAPQQCVGVLGEKTWPRRRSRGLSGLT